MSYLKLLLIRHAESLGNQAGCMEGQSSTALSSQGRWQAQQLSQYLSPQPFKDHSFASRHTDGYTAAVNRPNQFPSHCYSSPLLRAIQTAEQLVAPFPSLAVETDDALQELHPGIFQGLTWSEAVEQYPDLCRQLMGQRDYIPIPHAETLEAANHRAQQWLQSFLANHRPGQTVWVISHAGFMQYLIAQILGCDRIWQIAIDHTALFEFWLGQAVWEAHDPNRWNPEYWKLKRFNQTPHLPV